MKLRRTLNFHSLRKGKVRMTWNKYNLYNLSQATRKIPNFINRTFFQQKWTAKALTRAYHGEHIKEQKWTRMFDRRLRSVIDMNPKYMALNDGAEQATGRGSGRDTVAPEDLTPWQERGEERSVKVRGGHELTQAFAPLLDAEEVELEDQDQEVINHQMQSGQTPYMNMAYAPIERRIDVAIFRAMFASSTRQARNLVIHGKVKINGLPMNHATYLLNPGDMFQVDPDAVMFCTGKVKPKVATEERSSGPKKVRTRNPNKAPKAGKGTATAETTGEPAAAVEPAAAAAAVEAEAATEADEGSLEPAEAAQSTEVSTDASPEEVQSQLRFLARKAKQLLQNESEELGVKQKQRTRAFVKSAKELSSRVGRKDGASAITKTALAMIKQALAEAIARDPKIAAQAEQSGAFTPEAAAEATQAAAAASEAATPEEPKGEAPSRLSKSRDTAAWLEKKGGEKEYQLSPEDEKRLSAMVREYEDNPVDDSKPYKTPWEPRPYMSPFAFIPRYLEVNQNICAAVYLRHPVARQGMAEVPSPFPPEVQQLAHNWYLRRR